MDQEEEYEEKLATLERSLSWLSHNRGILMDVLAGPGHHAPSIKSAMRASEDDGVATTIDEGLKMLSELRSTSTFLIRTLKQRQSGPRMSLGTGLGLDDVVALVGEDHAGSNMDLMRGGGNPHASPEATAFLMNDSDEEDMDVVGGDSMTDHFPRASNSTAGMESNDPKLLEVIKEGYLYKLPLHVKKTDDHQAIPESKWKERYFKLNAMTITYYSDKSRTKGKKKGILGSGVSFRKGEVVWNDTNAMSWKGEIALRTSMQVRKSGIWPFSVVLEDDQGWVCLRAENEDDQQEWKNAFECALRVRAEQRLHSVAMHQNIINQIAFQQLVWRWEDVIDWNGLQKDMENPVVAASRTTISPSKKFKGHEDKIHSCAWSSDGELIVTAAKEPRLLIWDASKPNNRAQLAEVFLENDGWPLSCAISPSTSLVASGGMNEKVLVGSWRKQITAGRKYPLNPVGEHEGYVSSLCFLGDDRNLVSGSGDSFIRVWDVGAKTCKAKFTHSADVLAVASNPDNPDLILAAGADLECRVHDVRTTKCAGVFVGAESDIEHVAFNPALSHFFVGASGDGVCRVYDMRKNNSKPLVETPTQPYGCNQAEFSMDGRWLYVALQRSQWMLFDAYTGKEVKRVEGHTDVVSCLAVSESGMVCTGSWDSTIATWDLSHPSYWAVEHSNVSFDAPAGWLGVIGVGGGAAAEN